MPKAYNTFGNNAQKRGGCLSELVTDSECIQITPNGMTETKGLWNIGTPAFDEPPDEASIYHRPWYGQGSRKQPSGDKE